AGVALQPQEPPVDVPHQRTAIKIRPQPAVCPLGNAAVRALGIDAREQEARLPIESSPGRPHRAFVPGGEEDGVFLASGGWASGRDFQGGEVDLAAARPTFTRTPMPNASASWLLGGGVAEQVMNRTHSESPSVTRARPRVVSAKGATTPRVPTG